MKSEYLIGLNLGNVDPSATLFKGTQVLAHLEEERFTRKKKGIGQDPLNALKFCIAQLPNGIEDVKAINEFMGPINDRYRQIDMEREQELSKMRDVKIKKTKSIKH